MDGSGSDLDLWDAAAKRYEGPLADGSDWRHSLVIRPALLSNMLEENDEVHYETVRTHIARHVRPFAR